MSEPFIPAAVFTVAPAVQSGGLPGLRFMPPGTPIPHDGVVYRSRGSVLIIGDSAAAANAARELARRAPTLRIALFAPGADALNDLPRTVTAVGGRIVSLRGHLGRFAASVRVALEKVADAGIFSGNEDRHFDLVLDLGRESLLRQGVLPYGYHAPGDDAGALAVALDSLPQLTGNFHKPTYFDYRPQLCVHGAMGVAGCSRCMDVCDTAAIRSTGEKIEVDPFLCQGCAACTLACPTGAVEFRLPTPKACQAMLDELLAAPSAAADAPILVLHDAAGRHLLPAIEAAGVLLLEVNPLAAFSDVPLLTALAGGARAVVLAVAPDTPPRSQALIARKLDELRSIVGSLGGCAAALQVATPMNLGMAIERIGAAAVSPAPTFAPTDTRSGEKRARFLALADALARGWQTDNQEPCELAAGAAFGTVLVDAGKCTICHACTHLCPTGALSGRLEPAPTLCFNESLCVQCDLCRAGCPEQAIALQPRFLADAARRETVRELASDQLVSCGSCGTPFIGKRKLAVSLALMREHAKDMPGGIESLSMCPRCRQSEALHG